MWTVRVSLSDPDREGFVPGDILGETTFKTESECHEAYSALGYKLAEEYGPASESWYPWHRYYSTGVNWRISLTEQISLTYFENARLEKRTAENAVNEIINHIALPF